MIILGIETSCDETSAAIISDGKLLSNIVSTQEIHNKYGGVIPEVASREHEKNITFIVECALKKASITKNDIDAISFTKGPGLMGALLVGLNFAKGMSLGLGIPIIGVNHMEGHLYANLIDSSKLKFPFLCLLVSGGHTQLWHIREFGNYKLLGQTRDDAAGEAFDKGARILGMRYPGGPEIEKAAVNGNRNNYTFTIPKTKTSELDFSFSGIKTALLYTVQKLNEVQIKENTHHLAASYQEIIVDTLLDRLKKAISSTGLIQVAIAGGVAANKRFREKTNELKRDLNIDIFFPSIEFCTDNAAMIAMAGYKRLLNGEISALNSKAIPNLPMDENDHS